MKFYKMVFIFLIGISSVGANDDFNSEMSHVIGGAVMAGGITAIVDRYYPEYKGDRAMIGFWTSSAAIVIEQAVELALHGNAKGQALDAISHIAGSALGAFVTDQYLLTPLLNNSSAEGKYVGLTLQHSF